MMSQDWNDWTDRIDMVIQGMKRDQANILQSLQNREEIISQQIFLQCWESIKNPTLKINYKPTTTTKPYVVNIHVEGIQSESLTTTLSIVH